MPVRTPEQARLARIAGHAQRAETVQLPAAVVLAFVKLADQVDRLGQLRGEDAAREILEGCRELDERYLVLQRELAAVLDR